MPSWFAAAAVNRDGRLRNGWWVAAFLALLAALLAPAILVSAHLGREVTILDQVVIIALATVAIQAFRRRSVFEVTGRPDLRWIAQLALGSALGGLLMAAPALALTLGGWVRWEVAAANPAALWFAVLLMAGVAVAEELLFRGVLFQRLIAGIGLWPAQIVIGLFFVLTHLGNPGMDGATRIWAGVNIFVASILFGLAYVRTRSLALPIGLHFMANVTQGIVLGFGVSGAAEPSVLSPVRAAGMDWLTGGAFGLEASLPGLIAVLALVTVFAWPPRAVAPA
ncbi:MAG: CPBP family intramembrane glutamic endopeptidase [Brevundimonas sp.]|uniref:CPBP family intramembrane glutamic endopeptidase n=1 Tax=Brevundimonas sp. TaxID=1871086 RepID=UPI002AB9D501|nr:CPBP family intramembrane glutamic endopeptidase [Brevundimonas sp.]MDZ4113149.1 CPBP family intramembrane glutamic endopeptidase [Brevundimonas sp.]